MRIINVVSAITYININMCVCVGSIVVVVVVALIARTSATAHNNNIIMIVNVR